MTELSFDIPTLEKNCPPALLGDAYIASSLLQKAIRRSATQLALSALIALWKHRGKNVWRRIVVAAFEDVGVADISTVLKVIDLAEANYKSNDRQSLTAALAAVVMLSEAPKDRSADHLISAALKHPDYEWAKTSICKIAPNDRLQAAFSKNLNPLERANAIWFGVGLGCGGSDRLTAPNADKVTSLFIANGISEELAMATRMAVRVTQEPFVLMVPLLWWLKAHCSSQVTIISHNLPLSQSLLNVPSYTFDKHTRVGAQAIGQFATRYSPIANLLSKHVPDFRHRKAAHMAAFYADAVPVARQAVWSLSDKLEQLGMEGDMYSVGIEKADTGNIIEAFRGHLSELNKFRLERLEKSQNRTS